MKDLLGHNFDFTTPPTRVVSLVPSLTETLFDLGAGDAVAGITDFCIFPEGLDRPRVGGTKNPHIEEIRALAPDLVYMNLEENLERHAKQIAAFAPVFVTEPKTVDDVSDLITTLGAIHQCVEKARKLRDALAHERGAITAFAFAVPIWKKPWMWCGGDTYVSNLVESIGGRNVLHDRERYPALTLDEVLTHKPDIVFLPDEPYLFTSEDAAEIEGPRVIGPFPGHLFTWHGTRTILGLRFLRRVLPWMVTPR
ncbi:MAG TPA: helical backbone metal receptor [Thermoanaerobaculia bacterium]|jgi:ABC-type Fe3+-hydroxamate transport system substrate-binding protein|nr:helical backbone metal receptor [Thermoanaerobaculia bacterium]